MPGLTVSLAGRVAGLAAIAALHTYWFLQPVPISFKALTAFLVAVSIARPVSGLLAFAALAPLSTPIANLCGAAGMGGQLLEQMALALGAGVLLRGGVAAGRTRIGGPALLVAVVATASAASLLLAAALPLVPGVTDRVVLEHLWYRQAAQASPTWAPLFAAHAVVACALMGWSAERTVRAAPRLATPLVMTALIGHAAAAALNLNAVVEAAERTGQFLHALPELLLSVRLSMQTDVHAAASAFVLAGVAGFGLMSGSWARRAGVTLLLLLVATGLWITGSRVAIVIGIGAAVGALAWPVAQRFRGGRLVVAGIAVLALGAAVWLVALNPSSRYNPTSRSISSRTVLMKAGVQMFTSAPVFGIGIAKFYGTSAVVVGPDLTSLVGYPRENAHNNFVQVLAEQGLVGLGAMLWWLAVVLVSGARAQLAKPDAVRGALLLAIAACIGTWLTGHPLLVPEFALVFWLYCGILVATVRVPASPRVPWIAGIVVASVLVSVAPRALASRNAADLEHLGFGLSKLWEHDDAQRYREAGAAFSIFLPASDQPVAVPFRRAPGAPDPLVVDARLHGRILATIAVGGDAWHTPLLVVPKGPRRFELVEFTARLPASGIPVPDVLFRVGRDSLATGGR